MRDPVAAVNQGNLLQIAFSQIIRELKNYLANQINGA